MATAFSFAAWNVEHFGNEHARADRVARFLKRVASGSEDGDPPTVFGIFEVQGSDVFSAFTTLMPSHVFFISEGTGSLETLIGVKKGITAFITQRAELRSDLPTLRPGILVTLEIEEEFYSLLFLHAKAMSDPRSWGLRDDVMTRVGHLKNALDRATGRPEGASFIFLGDLNTTGLNLTYSEKDLSTAEELDRYARRFSRSNGIRLLPKTQPVTFWNGPGSSQPPIDFDHVFASKHMDFRAFAGGAEIAVRGWPELPTDAEKQAWISSFSDHALVYGEVRT